jgi:NTP pyrophosphatase (non-canonical NTP hydrolase)
MILEDALKLYGQDIQFDIAIEEMAELTKAIIKHKRFPSTYPARDIIEEAVDVYIMIRQIFKMWDGIFEDTVDQQLDFKLERLKNRIKIDNEISTD